jgi:hypothetical protein
MLFLIRFQRKGAKSAKLDEQALQRLKKFYWTTPVVCGK